jgi:hypothetical protein
MSENVPYSIRVVVGDSYIQHRLPRIRSVAFTEAPFETIQDGN